MNERQLVDTLVAIQHARRLSDAEMARRLCIGRAQWNHLRLGRRRLGAQSLGGIIAHFDDLREIAVDLLAQRATEVADVPAELATA